MHENEDSLLILFSSFYGSLFPELQILRYVSMGDGKVVGTISDLNNLDLYSVRVLGESSEWSGKKCLCFKQGNGRRKNILYGSEPQGS